MNEKEKLIKHGKSTSRILNISFIGFVVLILIGLSLPFLLLGALVLATFLVRGFWLDWKLRKIGESNKVLRFYSMLGPIFIVLFALVSVRFLINSW